MPLPAKIRDALRSAGQQHIIDHASELEAGDVVALEDELTAPVNEGVPLFEALPSLCQRLKEALAPPPAEPPTPPRGEHVLSFASDPPMGALAIDAREASAVGTDVLRAGQGAVVLMAGGSATRLRVSYPKGLFSPPQLVHEATLFEFHLRRLAALQNRVGGVIPLAIMTSSVNHGATMEYLLQKRFFGLDEEHVHVFRQSRLPVFLPDGRLLLESPGKLAWSPSGNGSIFAALKAAGVLRRFAAQDVRWVQIVAVDNLLCPIGDTAHFGAAVDAVVDVMPRWAPKRRDDEAVGVFAFRQGRLVTVEYSELGDLAAARDADGHRLFDCGNIGIYMMSATFLNRVATEVLPLHAARKVVPTKEMPDDSKRSSANAIVLEAFIFDAFVLAQQGRSALLQAERDAVFAPIKNATTSSDVDNAHTAVALLRDLHAKWICDAASAMRTAEGDRLADLVRCKDLRVDIPPSIATDPESVAKLVERSIGSWLQIMPVLHDGSTLVVREVEPSPDQPPEPSTPSHPNC